MTVSTMKFPYGISDFYTIRRHNYIYIDRTQYIAKLEAAGRQLLFLRPRRFGKSLWLSVLDNYYNINKRNEFDELFGDLHVGKQPTAERNQYLMLRWDFSEVSGQGDISAITRNLFDYLNESIYEFKASYQDLLLHDINIYPDNALGSFKSLLGAVNNSQQQLYLLVDEYDNFANEVLTHQEGGKKRDKDLLSGEGIFKALFKMIKAGASKSQIARVFITGVSPLVLSDMTSGYNVATDISQESRFNALCGIHKAELSDITQQVLAVCNPSEQLDDTLETMRQFYNGYRFTQDISKALVYNPTLCFYFLRHYQLECAAPTKMLGANLAMDAERIRYIANLPAGARVIEQVLDEQSPVSLRELETQFGVEKLQEMREQDPYVLSFLYYFGVLTITGKANLGKMQLGIPNLVVQKRLASFL